MYGFLSLARSVRYCRLCPAEISRKARYCGACLATLTATQQRATYDVPRRLREELASLLAYSQKEER